MVVPDLILKDATEEGLREILKRELGNNSEEIETALKDTYLWTSNRQYAEDLRKKFIELGFGFSIDYDYSTYAGYTANYYNITISW